MFQGFVKMKAETMKLRHNESITDVHETLVVHEVQDYCSLTFTNCVAFLFQVLVPLKSSSLVDSLVLWACFVLTKQD